MTDLKNMLSERGRGYDVAAALNDEMWEDLGTHKERMQEQVDRFNDNSQPQIDLQQAESIYEAARTHLAKFGKGN